MAATQTVAQSAQSAQHQIEVPRSGVVTLFGYGIKVHVDRGHLIIEDGIGSDRRRFRLARVGHGLKRLVVIGSDGFVSLAALRWLADQKAAFIMLERDGSVTTVTGPASPSDARLRRAQACADMSGAGLVIARELISRKLAGQAELASAAFRDRTTADGIAAFRAKLAMTVRVEDVRLIEAHAAQLYWSAWRNLPVVFPKTDLPRVPEHWRKFDVRRSPLTGSPQRAVNPPNAILNYLYSILEAESRLTLSTMGLDPGLGFIHADEKTRDNLACDLMEAVRPKVDAFVLDWIRRVPLKREWFFEQRDGNCRLMAPFAGQLANTARMWRSAVAPLAEWVAQTLWFSIDKLSNQRGPGTRLTHGRNRLAKGLPFLPPPEPAMPAQSVCRICGELLQPDRKYCPACFPGVNTQRIVGIAPSGWVATQTANAQALRAESMRRHEAGKAAWDVSNHPKWLTEEAYNRRVQPLLKRISTSRISTTLGVTWAYASNIRRGARLPHPRHWEALAKLVSVSVEQSQLTESTSTRTY